MTVKEFDEKIRKENETKKYFLDESSRIEQELWDALKTRDTEKHAQLRDQHLKLCREARTVLHNILGGRRILEKIERKHSYAPFG